MQNSEPTVFIVDDDDAVRGALSLLVRSVGLATETYASATEFLGRFDPERPGCLVLDIRMPGMSGIELQERLCAQGATTPVLFITGHGDIPMAVRAMQAGAVDFIEKPFNEQELLDRIQRALRLDAETRRERAGKDALRMRLDGLTVREREVMDRIVAGQANKVIALDLGLSERTVEVHRAKVMEKTGARSLAELVAMVIGARG